MAHPTSERPRPKPLSLIEDVKAFSEKAMQLDAAIKTLFYEVAVAELDLARSRRSRRADAKFAQAYHQGYVAALRAAINKLSF